MKKNLSILLIIALLAGGAWIFIRNNKFPTEKFTLSLSEKTLFSPFHKTIFSEVLSGIVLPEPVDYPLSHTYFNEQTQDSILDSLDASSSKKDDENYSYHQGSAVDTNYATAWCSDPSDASPWISMEFSTNYPHSPQTVGIIPGYATDETLFFENNRAKTIEMTINDDPTTTQTLEVKNEYAMQFFDINQPYVTNLSFKILEVYPGLKYNDTCFAEIDVWNDWVQTKDAAVAFTYYNDRPYLKICPGWPYDDTLSNGKTRIDPTESTEQGDHYVFPDLSFEFWTPPEYRSKNIHIFKNESLSLSFEKTDQAACTGYGDMMTPWIDLLEEGDYLYKEDDSLGEASWIKDVEALNFPSFQAMGYTQQELGAAIVVYEFQLNEKWIHAIGTFNKNEHDYDEPASQKDPFMYYILSTLKSL